MNIYKLPHHCILSLVLLAGCNSVSSADKGGSSGEARGDSVSLAAPAPEERTPATTVDKIVFVGKAKACDCTKETIATSWSALKEALAKGEDLPITKLQVDKDSEKVAVYRDQDALMAIPGIYLVSGESKVLELLQGEVTASQIGTALAHHRANSSTEAVAP